MSTADAQDPELHLLVPPGWNEVDVDPAHIESTLTELLGGDRDAVAGSVEFGRLEAQLRAGIVAASQLGALTMLAYHEFLPGGDPPLLAASVVVYLRRLARPLAEMTNQLNRDRATVDALELDGKSFTRVSSDGSVVIDGYEQPVAVRSVRYYSSVPDSEMTAVLAFSTPNVSLADHFVELFDSIASTFEIVLPA